jgi:hypothetical protein
MRIRSDQPDAVEQPIHPLIARHAEEPLDARLERAASWRIQVALEAGFERPRPREQLSAHEARPGARPIRHLHKHVCRMSPVDNRCKQVQPWCRKVSTVASSRNSIRVKLPFRLRDCIIASLP